MIRVPMHSQDAGDMALIVNACSIEQHSHTLCRDSTSSSEWSITGLRRIQDAASIRVFYNRVGN